MKKFLKFLIIFSLFAPYLYSAEEASAAPRDLRVHEAVRARDLHRLRDLYNRGVAFDERDERGNTPLHLAVRFGSLALVEFLIQENVFGLRMIDVNVRNSHGYTPLHIAVKAGRFKVVSALVKAGADTTACTDEVETPLSLAAERGLIRIATLLQSNGGSQVSNIAPIPLNTAAARGHLPVVKMLARAGADVSERDEYDHTPLQYAVVRNQIELVSFLLLNGASAQQGYTNILHDAVDYGRVEITAVLLRAGIDPNVCDWRKRTPLFYTVFANEIAELLIHAGADVDARDENGLTPLHFFVQCLRLDGMKLLMYHGADVEAKKTGGKTPLAWGLKLVDEAPGEVFHIEGKKVQRSEYTRVIEELLKIGVKISKDDLKLLKKHYPYYHAWLKEKKEALEEILKETVVAQLPTDLQSEIQSFVLTSLPRTRRLAGADSNDPRPAKRSRNSE